MFCFGRLPLLETVEPGTRIVVDAKLGWLRAMRSLDCRYFGIASERMEAGQIGIFSYQGEDDRDDVHVRCVGWSHHRKFLPEFSEYIESLGKIHMAASEAMR